MKHCNEIQMERMLKNKLTRLESILCRIHLFFCHECRDTFLKMKDDHTFVTEFRQGVLIMEKAHLDADAIEKEQPKRSEYTEHKEIANV